MQTISIAIVHGGSIEAARHLFGPAIAVIAPDLIAPEGLWD